MKFQAGIQEKSSSQWFYASPAFKDQYEEVQTSLVAGFSREKVNENLGFFFFFFVLEKSARYVFIHQK